MKDLFDAIITCAVAEIANGSCKFTANKKTILEHLVSKRQEQPWEVRGIFHTEGKNPLKKTVGDYIYGEWNLPQNPYLRASLKVQKDSGRLYSIFSLSEDCPSRKPSELRDILFHDIMQKKQTPSHLTLAMVLKEYPEQMGKTLFFSGEEMEFPQRYLKLHLNEFFKSCPEPVALEIMEASESADSYFYQKEFKKAVHKAAGMRIDNINREKTNEMARKLLDDEREACRALERKHIGKKASDYEDGEELTTLEPLYTEFALSLLWQIYLASIGTGGGKNHAFLPFSRNFLLNDPDKYGGYYYLIFMSDNRQIVRTNYEECLEYNRDIGEGILYIRSNFDNILLGSESREKEITDETKGREIDETVNTDKLALLRKVCYGNDRLMSLYEALRRAVEDYINTKKTSERMTENNEPRLPQSCFDDLRKKIGDREGILRKAIVETVEKTDGYPHGCSSKKKYDFICRHPQYKYIPDIYPAVKIRFSKVIFITIQKALYPIDTLFFGQVNFTLRGMGKKTFFFIDEADSTKTSIAEVFAENAAKKPVEFKSILEFGKLMADTLLAEKAPSIFTDEKVIRLAEELEDEYDKVNRKYYIQYAVKYSEELKGKHNTAVLYSSNSNIMIDKNGTRYSHNVLDSKSDIWCKVDTKDVCLRLYTSKPSGKCFLLSDYIWAIGAACTKVFSLWYALSLLHLHYNEQRHVMTDIYQSIEDVGHFFSSNIFKRLRRQELDTIISLVAARENVHAERATKEHDDYYLDGYDLVTARNEENSVTAEFEHIVCRQTAEGFLYNLLCGEENKIMLVSATSTVNSIYSNYDIEWSKITSRMYTPGKKTSLLVKKYMEKRQSLRENYVKDNLHIVPLPGSNDYDLQNGMSWEPCARINRSIEEDAERTAKELGWEEMAARALAGKLRSTLSATLTDIQNIMLENRISDFPKYEYLRAADLFRCILLSCIKKCHFGLLINRYNPKIECRSETWRGLNSNDYEKMEDKILALFINLLERIRKSLPEEYCQPFAIRSISAENIGNKMEDACADAATGEIFSVVLSSYQTFGKSINPQFPVPRGLWDNTVPINENGRKTKEGRNENARIDADVIYLGDVTNIPSPLVEYTDNKPYFEIIKSEILACNNINSGFFSGAAGIKERNNKLRRVVRRAQNRKYALSDYAKDDIFNARMKILIQMVGRLSRTDLRWDNVYIYYSRNNIIKNASSSKDPDGDMNLDRFCVFSDEYLAMQSIEVREFLTHFRSELEAFDSENANSGVDMMNISGEAYQCRMAVRAYKDAMEENFKKGSPAKMKLFQKSAKSVYLTENEYNSLPEEAKVLYLKRPENSGDGYDIDGHRTKDGRETIVNAVYFVHPGAAAGRYSAEYITKKSGEKFGIVKAALIEEGIRLAIPEGGKYILTPKGFDLLEGHIGEAVIKHILHEIIGFVQIPMPDPAYERMDLLYKVRGNLFAVDAKWFYSNAAAVREMEKGGENVERYLRKCETIKETVGGDTQVVPLVINAHPEPILPEYTPVNPIRDRNNNMVGYGIPNLLTEKGTINPTAYKFLAALYEKGAT